MNKAHGWIVTSVTHTGGINTPWLIAAQEPFGLHCVRCGGSLTVDLPMPLPAYVEEAKTFMAVHQHCAVEQEGAG